MQNYKFYFIFKKHMHQKLYFKKRQNSSEIEMYNQKFNSIPKRKLR